MKTFRASHFLVLVVSAHLISCHVDETPPKELAPFHSISANGMVTFRLVTGAENQVLSTNMSESFYNVSNGVLTVNASGGIMTIAIKDLNSLWCNACNVDNKYPLVADTLNMSIHAGSVDLQDIQINGRLSLYAINTGTYKFSGTASFLVLSMINAVSFEGYNLVTDSTHIDTQSIVSAEVNATQVLNAHVRSIGNVYYKGNPPIVRASYYGSGKLIPK